jgi:hypothetical protein
MNEPDDDDIEQPAHEMETPSWISNLANDQNWIDASFEEMAARTKFIELVSCGTAEFNAGIEVGWTPAKIRTILADREFAELVSFSRHIADGNMEQTLYKLGQAKGNMAAIQMWLYNRQPDRWRDVKRIEVRSDTTIHVGVVHSVKASALALLGERSVAELQQLAIEATATDE